METLQPKLRFPEFKGDWEEKLFEEIYSFRTTNSLSRDKLNYENGTVKNIHYGDIHSKFNTLFNIENELVPFINEEVDIKRISNDNYCKVKDLIIADASEDYNDIGKAIEIVSLSDKKVLAGLHTFLARPDKTEMSIGFGGYLLKSDLIKKQIKLIAQGTKVLSISTGRVNKIKTIIPSLPEQSKIATFLTATDDKINQLTQKKSLLDQYKKGIMQKIFSQELRFKDDNGKDFEDWEEKTLDEVAIFRRGSFPQPYGLKKWYDELNGMPFVQVFDVDDNMKLKLITKSKISKLGAEQSVFVKEGTLVLTIQGSIGRIAKTQYDSYVDRTLLIFQSYKVPIHIDYFKYIVFLLFEIEKTKAPGGIIKTITKEVLSSFIVFIPSIKEQIQIANFLSAIDEKINQVNTQLEQTTQYKKGLLQQMFV